MYTFRYQSFREDWRISDQAISAKGKIVSDTHSAFFSVVENRVYSFLADFVEIRFVY